MRRALTVLSAAPLRLAFRSVRFRHDHPTERALLQAEQHRSGFQWRCTSLPP